MRTTDAPASRFCESSHLLVDANFTGGNFYNCQIVNENEVSVRIRPEDAPPINKSPWYSLRISPKRATETIIHFTFDDGYARYWPKSSHDGVNWAPIAEQFVAIPDGGTTMTVTIPLSQDPLWVSAQELLLPSYYHAWVRDMSRHPDVTTQVLGRSVEGRPIHIAQDHVETRKT